MEKTPAEEKNVALKVTRIYWESRRHCNLFKPNRTTFLHRWIFCRCRIDKCQFNFVNRNMTWPPKIRTRVTSIPSLWATTFFWFFGGPLLSFRARPRGVLPSRMETHAEINSLLGAGRCRIRTRVQSLVPYPGQLTLRHLPVSLIQSYQLSIKIIFSTEFQLSIEVHKHSFEVKIQDFLYTLLQFF